MASVSISCPSCSATDGVVRNGKSTAGHQRYLCSHCRKTWQLQFTYTGTVAKLAMRQPFVLFKGLTFQKLCLPGAFRPGDHHNKMLRPGLCVVHASPQYL
ncbi:TPA: IS1 family transposase [Escherichia coli]|nr:IS1 family transposase [Escherichia coli]